MATEKEQPKKESKDKVNSLLEVFSVRLYGQVALKEISMAEAGRMMRKWLAEQPEENQAKIRSDMRQWGTFMQSVAEGFLQELTVIGAGQ